MRPKRRSALRVAWVLGVLAAVLVLPPLLWGGMSGRWCECEFRAAPCGWQMSSTPAAARPSESVRQREVLQQLLAGRLTVAAAAERFRTLSAASASFPMQAVRAAFPAAREQESWCRSVLACAAMEFAIVPMPGETRSTGFVRNSPSGPRGRASSSDKRQGPASRRALRFERVRLGMDGLPIDVAFGELGEFLVCGRLLVERFLQQAGRFLLTQAIRERAEPCRSRRSRSAPRAGPPQSARWRSCNFPGRRWR